MNDWASIVDKLGVPVAVMAAMGFVGYKTIMWFGVNVVVPLKDRHITFVDDLKGLIESVVNNQVKLDNKVEKLIDTVSAEMPAFRRRENG